MSQKEQALFNAGSEKSSFALATIGFMSFYSGPTEFVELRRMLYLSFSII